MKLFLSMILLVSSVLFADGETQTNWMGGPGVFGPVIHFGSTFMSSTGIDYSSEPGKIYLLQEALSNPETLRMGSLPLVAYPDSGILESSILDTQLSSIPWDYLSFYCELPQSTSIGIQVRASNDYNDMGPWSGVFMVSGDLEGVLDESANFVQYRAVLFTANPDTTPALKDVTITWGWGAVAESHSSVPQSFSSVIANPAHGSVEAEINLSSPSSVDISVFDLSGRLVRETETVDCESGRQTVMLGVFTPGVYIVLMRSGEFSTFQRFAVVE
jgi:hypothetical protein